MTERPEIWSVPIDDLPGVDVAARLGGSTRVVALVGHHDDTAANAAARYLPQGVAGAGVEEIVFVRTGPATGTTIAFEPDAWPGEDRTFEQPDLGAAVGLALDLAGDVSSGPTTLLVTGDRTFLDAAAAVLGSSPPADPGRARSTLICATCAVEHDEPAPAVCAICDDDRQYVPETGQAWTTLADLAAAGQTIAMEPIEPDAWSITTRPDVGIGQHALLVRTPHGSLLWDPPGYLDDALVAEILAQGPVLAVAASHPHMFGVQVEWGHRLGDVPVLVCEADASWLGRRSHLVELWSGRHEVAPGLVLRQVGGHFVGSAVAHWQAGADGRGVLLTGDTVFPNPDHRSIGFMRSYPNKIPLSGTVALRIASDLETFDFDRIYGNFGNVTRTDARRILRDSAERHAAWARGDHDDLT